MSFALILTGHGAALPYVFHTYVDGSAEEKAFGDIVSRYWGNFVKNGNPNTPQGSCAADGQCTVSFCENSNIVGMQYLLNLAVHAV